MVKPPASRVCAGASERQRLGDAPNLDVVGYKLPSPFGEEMPRTSVHVVQVLRQYKLRNGAKTKAGPLEAEQLRVV